MRQLTANSEKTLYPQWLMGDLYRSTFLGCRAIVPKTPNNAKKINQVNLPSTVPIDDSERLCALQLHLLHKAEDIFGPRDSSLQAYQPQLAEGGSLTILTGLELCRPRFTEDGPQINFDFNTKGVFAELSRYGERYCLMCYMNWRTKQYTCSIQGHWAQPIIWKRVWLLLFRYMLNTCILFLVFLSRSQRKASATRIGLR